MAHRSQHKQNEYGLSYPGMIVLAILNSDCMINNGFCPKALCIKDIYTFLKIHVRPIKEMSPSEWERTERVLRHSLSQTSYFQRFQYEKNGQTFVYPSKMSGADKGGMWTICPAEGESHDRCQKRIDKVFKPARQEIFVKYLYNPNIMEHLKNGSWGWQDPSGLMIPQSEATQKAVKQRREDGMQMPMVMPPSQMAPPMAYYVPMDSQNPPLAMLEYAPSQHSVYQPMTSQQAAPKNSEVVEEEHNNENNIRCSDGVENTLTGSLEQKEQKFQQPQSMTWAQNNVSYSQPYGGYYNSYPSQYMVPMGSYNPYAPSPSYSVVQSLPLSARSQSQPQSPIDLQYYQLSSQQPNPSMFSQQSTCHTPQHFPGQTQLKPEISSPSNHGPAVYNVDTQSSFEQQLESQIPPFQSSQVSQQQSKYEEMTPYQRLFPDEELN